MQIIRLLEDNVNLLGLIGAIAIVGITLFVAGKYYRQMKQKKQDNAELSEHSWDGISEYKNPPPLGWAICYIATLVWAIWYLVFGYPVNSYSQIGEYNEEVNLANEKFKTEHQNLSKDSLYAIGSSVFSVQCASCHGLDASGISGRAADLNVWGSEDGIYNTVIQGSKGLGYDGGEMPAASDFGLSEDDAKAIASYVAKEISGIRSTKYPDLVTKGKELYVATCTACHGDDSKGQDGVFPDLTTYGTEKFVVNVLNRGKHGFIGVMPKFEDARLNDIQKQAVGEYVISLSKDN